jgi:ribosomal 50S subunit-associated protein YjgA (DUF615 family)
LRQEKQEQQQDKPQQAQRMIHQITEKMIKPPTIITAMTGHLKG